MIEKMQDVIEIGLFIIGLSFTVFLILLIF